MLLMEVFVPLGMLSALSLAGMYDFRMNMVAGAFWLLLSPALMNYGLYFGLCALVGLAHFAYFVRCVRTNRFKIKMVRTGFDIRFYQEVPCQI